ncbi:c-type cytochrome [Sphaerotilus sp.]|uniref:c-type cytochrome n=1 Tax=Sphaerotilus sp. TaxID=2093942 RepID=UPI00286E964C|nr:c-type cytochrome [Sphaerotilus sp.]
MKHLVTILLLAINLPLAFAETAENAGPARGRAIYQDGRRPDGSGLRARRADLPDMTGTAAACAQCHRRSGLGDQEGRLRVPPITAASLFAPGRAMAVGRAASGIGVAGTRTETRPAYTADSFARALRSGTDPAGRALAPWMPRYDLDDAAVADLLAWLQQIGPVGGASLRGLVDGTLHLATIVTPDAPAARRGAVETTLAAWARQQTFGEVRVALHVWRLTGEPAGWSAQLQHKLAAQPVYAVVSGAGAAQWAPVEAFCEAASLPCVFPLIDGAPASAPAAARHHALYLSEGLVAEARVAARAVAALAAAPARLRVWFDSDLGRDAAQAFQALLGQAGPDVQLRDLRTQPVAMDQALAAPDDLVLAWLAAPQVRALLAPTADARQADTLPAVWLSAQLAPPETLDLAPAWRARVRWASLRATPERFRAAAVTGLQPWLRTLGMDPLQATPLQGEVYAAAYFFTDALQRSRGAWSVEHLLERLEAGVNNRAAAGAYLRLSLGQGQRVAAQVGQIQGWAPPDYRTLVPLSPVLNANR